MTEALDSLDALTERVLAAPRRLRRRLVALAGAPGSGKSTLADQLASALDARGCAVRVVPMDGFHLDNRVLTAMGMLDRKGAPETFDVLGFSRLMPALGTDDTVYYPLFDRSHDIAIAGAGHLDDTCDTVIVEGNYLLLDAPEWRDLLDRWDLCVRLDVPLSTLRERLIDRWLNEGLAQEAAVVRAEENDLRNARLVQSNALPADVVFDGSPSRG